jgi:signal peptidase I
MSARMKHQFRGLLGGRVRGRVRGRFRGRVKGWVKGWGASLLVAILIATSFKSAVAELNHVPTGSMIPTIIEGDRILVNKLAYDLKIPYTTIHVVAWCDPERGDIVVFNSPEDGTRLVKRVVGLPGDKISMINNRLYINGDPLAYGPLQDDGIDHEYLAQIVSGQEMVHLLFAEGRGRQKHPVMWTPSRPFLRTFPEILVPDRSYFMMGDNRDNSKDSRFFGFVPRKQILGQSKFVFASLDNANYHTPRWHRFLYKLP